MFFVNLLSDIFTEVIKQITHGLRIRSTFESGMNDAKYQACDIYFENNSQFRLMFRWHKFTLLIRDVNSPKMKSSSLFWHEEYNYDPQDPAAIDGLIKIARDKATEILSSRHDALELNYCPIFYPFYSLVISMMICCW